MSGYTRPKSPLQIAQEQISRLTNETSRLRNNNSNLQRQIGAQSANSRQRLQSLRDEMNKRQRAFGRMVDSLRSNLRGTETRFNEAIHKQGRDFYDGQAKQKADFQNRLSNQRNWTKQQLNNERDERVRAINTEKKERIAALEQQRQWTEREIARERARTDKAISKERKERIKALERERELTNQQIKALDEEINARIDAERALTNEQIDNLRTFTESQLKEQRAEYHRIALEKQKQIDTLKADVQSIFDQTSNQTSYAEDYLSDLGKIIAEINKSVPHQKFAPGRLMKISRKVNQAQANLSLAPQATIANAQEAYFDLVELREEILEKEAEYNIWYNSTLETLRALQEIINDNREVELDGAKQEADYWTKGKYDAFEEKVKKILNEVEVNEELTIEDIKEIHASIEDLRVEHEDLIKEALNQIMASQLRFEIAKATAKSLSRQGYRVVQKGYEGENGNQDPRKAYLVRMSDGRHELVAIVNPESSTANSLVINSSDSTYKNSNAALERMREIARTIKEEKGIELSTPICADEASNTIQDIYGPAFDEVYKNGIPKKIREQLGINDPSTKTA